MRLVGLEVLTMKYKYNESTLKFSTIVDAVRQGKEF